MQDYGLGKGTDSSVRFERFHFGPASAAAVSPLVSRGTRKPQALKRMERHD
jgi:hypothetical protein